MRLDDIDNAILSKQDEKDLENLVDEALEEVEALENIKQYEELPKMSVTNEKLHAAIIDSHKSILGVSEKVVDLKDKGNDNFIEQMKELHFLKKHYLKITATLITIACTFSYIAGTQHSITYPYVAKVWEIVNPMHVKGE